MNSLFVITDDFELLEVKDIENSRIVQPRARTGLTTPPVDMCASMSLKR
jgi:hypothetical protein